MKVVTAIDFLLLAALGCLLIQGFVFLFKTLRAVSAKPTWVDGWPPLARPLPPPPPAPSPRYELIADPYPAAHYHGNSHELCHCDLKTYPWIDPSTGKQRIEQPTQELQPTQEFPLLDLEHKRKFHIGGN